MLGERKSQYCWTSRSLKKMRKMEGRTPVIIILFVYLLPLFTPTVALFGPLAMRVQAESGQQVKSYLVAQLNNICIGHRLLR